MQKLLTNSVLISSLLTNYAFAGKFFVGTSASVSQSSYSLNKEGAYQTRDLHSPRKERQELLKSNDAVVYKITKLGSNMNKLLAQATDIIANANAKNRLSVNGKSHIMPHNPIAHILGNVTLKEYLPEYVDKGQELYIPSFLVKDVYLSDNGVISNSIFKSIDGGFDYAEYLETIANSKEIKFVDLVEGGKLAIQDYVDFMSGVYQLRDEEELAKNIENALDEYYRDFAKSDDIQKLINSREEFRVTHEEFFLDKEIKDYASSKGINIEIAADADNQTDKYLEIQTRAKAVFDVISQAKADINKKQVLVEVSSVGEVSSNILKGEEGSAEEKKNLYQINNEVLNIIEDAQYESEATNDVLSLMQNSQELLTDAENAINIIEQSVALNKTITTESFIRWQNDCKCCRGGWR